MSVIPTRLEVLDFIDAANDEIDVTVNLGASLDMSPRQFQRMRAVELACEARAAAEMRDARLIRTVREYLEADRRNRKVRA